MQSTHRWMYMIAALAVAALASLARVYQAEAWRGLPIVASVVLFNYLMLRVGGIALPWRAVAVRVFGSSRSRERS